MFTVFSITNGKTTHSKSLESLNYPKVICIKNKPWRLALQTCVEQCTTPFFLRMDDDFFLHPHAYEYLRLVVNNDLTPNVGMYYWNLWEDFSHLIVHAIKIYRLEAIKSIGGFQFNELGKTDKATNDALVAKGWQLKEDKSIVAIHACGSKAEQIYYNDLWKAQSKMYQKARFDKSLLYDKSIEYQYDLRTTFLENLNEKYNTSFGEMLKTWR